MSGDGIEDPTPYRFWWSVGEFMMVTAFIRQKQRFYGFLLPVGGFIGMPFCVVGNPFPHRFPVFEVS